MKNKILYNYLVNTLQISKDLVTKQIDIRIDDLIEKFIKNKMDAKYIERLILNRVTQVVVEGVATGWYGRDDFDKYLKTVIKQVVEEKFNDEYNLDVKVISKDKQTIKRI